MHRPSIHYPVVTLCLLFVLSTVPAHAGDEPQPARLPYAVFAESKAGDWLTLAGTATGRDGAKGPIRLAYEVTETVVGTATDSVRLRNEGNLAWQAYRYQEFARGDAPAIAALFEILGTGKTIAAVQVADEMKTVGGREFACKKLAFDVLAKADPPVHYIIWLCPEVTAPGIVGLHVAGGAGGAEMAMDFEVAGFGGLERPAWRARNAADVADPEAAPEAAGLEPVLLPWAAHRPGTGRNGGAEVLPVATVLVNARGRCAFAGLEPKVNWRGLKFPIDRGRQETIPAPGVREEIRVFLKSSPEGVLQFRIGNRSPYEVRLDGSEIFGSPEAVFTRTLEEVAGEVMAIRGDFEKAGHANVPVLLDIDPGVSFAAAAALIATLVEEYDVTPELAAPLPSPAREAHNAARALLARLGGRLEPEGPNRFRAGLRVRADARVSWGPVADVLAAAAETGLSRYTIAVRDDYGERDLFTLQSTPARPSPGPIPIERPMGKNGDDEPEIFFPEAKESDHNETADDETFEKMGVGGTDNEVFAGRAGPYGGRTGGRENLVARGGGSRASEAAVEAGLHWLARHQGADGGWHADFAQGCAEGTPCSGESAAENDTGITGLALLAFLGRGFTPLSRDGYEDPHAHRPVIVGEVVQKGIDLLLAQQDADGCCGPRTGAFLYGHAIATTALAEAYGITQAKPLREPVQKGIDFLQQAQNPGGAWRYGVRPGENDTSVTGWAISALHAADAAGLRTPRSAYEGAMAWLREVTEDGGRVGYNRKGRVDVFVPGKNEAWSAHPTMTAIGLLVRIVAERNARDPLHAQQSALLIGDLPRWAEPAQGKPIDYYYWYYGACALFQLDGPSGPIWNKWNRAMTDALVRHQKLEADGCADGSWDSQADRWGFAGGRVYATALNVLTLETYYRCERVLRGK